jgi:hypothetical protein
VCVKEVYDPEILDGKEGLNAALYGLVEWTSLMDFL